MANPEYTMTNDDMVLFEPGDTVWWLEGSEAKRGKVLRWMQDREDLLIEYDIEDTEGVVTTIDEADVYPCPEALVRDIFAEYNPEDIEIELNL